MEKYVIEELLEINKIKDAKITGENREISLEIGGKKVNGFTTCIFLIYQTQIDEDIFKKNISLVHHWLSYFSREFFHCSSQQELQRCLKYIDSELLVKSYLCGFEESIADIVLFISLSPFVNTWDYYTKEQFINISRWISVLQRSSLLKGMGRSVTFSKTLLYC
ncbi:UNVERIFIED_CONTAM: hypothetical protein RMT77_006630 [Armadillidium vulgare]